MGYYFRKWENFGKKNVECWHALKVNGRISSLRAMVCKYKFRGYINILIDASKIVKSKYLDS